MSRRIDIEITSARPDGTWTWRAAGAREPKGVLDGALLPEGTSTGAVLKADADFGLDGTTILAVSATKAKAEKDNVLQILPSDKPFEEVTQQLTGRKGGGDRRDRPRRDDDRGPRGPRRDRPDGHSPGGGRDRPGEPAGAGRGGPAGRGPGRSGQSEPRGTDRDRPGGDRAARRGPRFAAPPELPQRPRAKRLKPGRVHRSAVLAELPEEQRAVAERALQGGLPAVRQAVNEQNARLKAEGKEEIPAVGLLNMAEQLLPKLRVAEWLDRADAALRDKDDLDLRDLRSVVAAAEDPVVARDESTRTLAAELKEALAAKQDKELNLWFGDIEAAIGVGRIVRALKLSSQPPKAGIRFPADLAGKLAGAATASLSTDSLAERWVAVLEAAAFSPIRSHVQPTDKPTQVTPELLATVTRIGSLLPHIAGLFGIEIDPKASPKPLRPTRPTAAKKAPVKTIPPPPAPDSGAEVAAPAAESEMPQPEEAPGDAQQPVAEVITEPTAPDAEQPAPDAEQPAPEAEQLVSDQPAAEAVAPADDVPSGSSTDAPDDAPDDVSTDD